MMAAANHDPARFEDPEKFDIERQDVAHQSFGGGAHFCIGNQLGRMEARHAIGQFVERTKDLRIERGQLEWSHSFFRIMSSMPITFH
jgi:hypothetical protein